MKDLFSKQADDYSKYRPTYPKELFDFLYSKCNSFDMAWDCGTGDGQIASVLSSRFNKVIATDVSKKQLNKAKQAANIEYQISPAEQTHFENQIFDLITVGQAIHWFNHDDFFKEVERVMKPNGILAFWGYDLLRVDQEIDQLIDYFYQEIIGSYWDQERRLIETHYQTISTPFEEIECPSFAISYKMNKEHLLGYLSSWSSVQKYKNVNGKNPVLIIQNELNKLWKSGQERDVNHPIFMRVCLLQN